MKFASCFHYITTTFTCVQLHSLKIWVRCFFVINVSLNFDVFLASSHFKYQKAKKVKRKNMRPLNFRYVSLDRVSIHTYHRTYTLNRHSPFAFTLWRSHQIKHIKKIIWMWFLGMIWKTFRQANQSKSKSDANEHWTCEWETKRPKEEEEEEVENRMIKGHLHATPCQSQISFWIESSPIEKLKLNTKLKRRNRNFQTEMV